MDVTNLANEKELLLEVSDGDERAFSALFYHYQPLLYSYTYRITKSETTAEEIVQDVFLKIWMSRESLSGINSFKDYIFIVSRNHTLNFIKKLASEHEMIISLKDHLSREAQTNDPSVSYGTIIDEAISHLPPQQQKVYLLSRHEGLKYNEIAAAMGIAPRTVKSYMKLAILSIKTFVKEKAVMPIAFFALAYMLRMFFK